MASKYLEFLDKAADFIKEYTGSNYNYTEPSGEINENYQQIGEILGFPIYMDDNRRYESEFLDLPSLGDIVDSIANIGINFEIKKSDCSVCLVTNYSIPLITYPPIVICLAKPDCRKEEEEEPKPTCRAINWNTGMPDGVDTSRPTDWREPPENLQICDSPSNEDFYLNPPPKDPDVYVKVTVWANAFRLYWGIQQTKYPYLGGYVDTQISYSYDPPGRFKVGEFHVTSPVDISKTQFNGPNGYSGQVFINDQLIGNYHAATSQSRSTGNLDDAPEYMQSASFFMSYSLFTYQFEYEGEPLPPNANQPDPSTPAIPDPTVDMNNNCCEDIKKILARIEKQVKDVSKILDVEGFKKKNIQVPANWLYPTNEGKPVLMEDLPDLIASVARLVDRRIGFLPQLVRIKDADPVKEGDQQLDLVVNSIADFNRLILEYLLQAHGDIGGIQMMNTANLYEAGITHQIAVSMWAELQAISEYLDYETKQKKESFRMAFNPKIKIDERNPEGLDKILPRFLKPSIQQVEVNEFRGGKTLKDIVNDIKKDTSNTAASVTRKLSNHSLDDLVEETQNIETIKRLLLVRDIQEREGVQDLKSFLEDAEGAYPSTESPARRYDKPYGFQPSNKPKMKVTTNKSRKNKQKK